MTLTYQQKKILCANRPRVFSNNATGGGDNTTDEGAANVDPNKSLAPVIGGSKTFNIVFYTLISIAAVIIVLQVLNIIQIKKLSINASN